MRNRKLVAVGHPTIHQSVSVGGITGCIHRGALAARFPSGTYWVANYEDSGCGLVGNPIYYFSRQIGYIRDARRANGFISRIHRHHRPQSGVQAQVVKRFVTIPRNGFGRLAVYLLAAFRSSHQCSLFLLGRPLLRYTVATTHSIYQPPRAVIKEQSTTVQDQAQHIQTTLPLHTGIHSLNCAGPT
ncbi:hypothetical protein F4823DRAFT_52023 [Ustulina deusta]|nr:hypothetical protein F4823DRAFT_52023 [Ustulina deusta]